MTRKEAIEMLKRNCYGCMHPQQMGWCKSHCEIGIAIESIENYHRLKHIIGETLIDVDKCHMSPRDALEEIRNSIKSH